jgi:hypothetical protein
VTIDRLLNMKTIERLFGATVAATVLATSGYSQAIAPAPTSLPPCLILNSSTYLYGSSSELILYRADQTFDVISSVATSETTTPSGNIKTTYPPVSGTYTYTVDPQNPSHATIVSNDGAVSPFSQQFYFFSPLSATPYLGLPTLGTSAWSQIYPEQTTNGGANVSNRCQLTAGGIAISGFVVQSNGPRWVLIRAVGASLANFGVSSTVSAPSFTLRDSTQAVVGASSVWSSDPNLKPGYSTIFSIVGAFPLNSGSDEGVLLVPLNPGAYTAVFSAGSAGTILCEVYILPY